MADGETVLPTMHSPSVIMMGSEASGLNAHIKSHADSIVSIPGARHSAHLGVESDPARIDSLNVSVAAALLMEMFLRTPLAMSEPIKKSKGRVW
jgi:23S rRNA (guanosine2251-2'-O)-methyltransferase/21S rRNA (GM2251-2'-O)-methyltransferase